MRIFTHVLIELKVVLLVLIQSTRRGMELASRKLEGGGETEEMAKIRRKKGQKNAVLQE